MRKQFKDREIQNLARLAERMGETEAAVEALSEAAEQSAPTIKRPYAGPVSAGKPVASESR